MSYLTKLRDRLAGSALLKDQAGLSTVEYVIILVLIAAISIGTWKTFGGEVKKGLDKANKSFTENVGSATT